MKRNLALAALAAGATAPLACRASEVPRMPNVVFVIADEWRYQATGYAGDPNVQTPALDRFAAESVNVRNAISGCSVCCPARASIMTGQYPLTDGVYINDVSLVPRGVTLGEAFARAGYDTGYIGKWHLYGSPAGRHERRGDYIPPDKRFGFEYWKAAECCHSYNNSFYYEDDDPKIKYWPGYDAIAQTTDACRYIRDRAAGAKPFFLFLSYGPPHFPTDQAPPKYQERYRHRTLQMRPNVPALDRVKAQVGLRGYYANIAAVDDCFARVLAALDAAGVAENTVVIFTSDHGDMMYSQGLMYKLLPWEESLRVPLLVRYPKKFGQAGAVSDALFNTPDMMPTLLGLCGLPIPPGLQGRDWSDTLLARGKHAPESAFIDMPVSIGPERWYGVAEYRGVRTERYTYVRSIHGPWLLYDDQADPYQMHNLCDQAGMAAVQRQMERELRGWLHRLDDRFLPGADYLKRDRLGAEIETKFPVLAVKSPWGDWQSNLERSSVLSSYSAIVELMGQPAAKAVLQRIFPEVVANPILTGPMNVMSLRILAATRTSNDSLPQLKPLQALLTDARLQQLDEGLAGMPRVDP